MEANPDGCLGKYYFVVNDCCFVFLLKIQCRKINVSSKMSDKEKFLGEFEQIVLLAILQLDSDAYGAVIRQLLHEQINRNVAIGALYSTLERLEKKAMVSSKLGESTPERGGRAKRYFEVTAKGQQALSRSRDAFNTMWQGVNIVSSAKLNVECLDV